MKSFARFAASPAVVSALVALALTGLLYGDALALPLFSDDLVQIPWLESISWAELWLGPSPYGYYRPLWYTLWRTWGLIAGGLRPSHLHLINLMAHFCGAWLVGLLASAWMEHVPSAERQDARRGGVLTAGLATALFTVFPFSRQAVAWPGAVYNPLVSAMAAGAILAHDRGRRCGAVGWTALSLLLTALAPFTYEAGLMVGPVVVLAECVGSLYRRYPRRLSWWPLAFIGVGIATAFVWRSIRGAGVTGLGLSLVDLWRNASYLVQGLTYPTAPLAQGLVVYLAIDPELALWIVALPVLIVLSWRGAREHRGTSLLGAGWFLLFALPPVVTMKAEWFALAPRFLYTTAAGVSLMWVGAMSEQTEQARLNWRRGVSTLLVLILLVAPAGRFIRDGMRLYQLAGRPIWEASAAAARAHPLLVVNLPLQITPSRRTFPLGFEGITPLPARVTAEGLVRVHTGIQDAAEAVSFGIVASDAPSEYTYQLTGREVGWQELADAMRQAQSVYLTRFGPQRIHLMEAGGAARNSASRGVGLGHFGKDVVLVTAQASCDSDEGVRLTTVWRAEATISTDVTVFAHLLAPDGSLVTQADGYPLLGMLPFWLWTPGEAFRDVRYFDTGAAAESAEGYRVRIGLWELATGEHWPAEGTLDGTVTLSVHCR
jgi:hypothetical protein